MLLTPPPTPPLRWEGRVATKIRSPLPCRGGAGSGVSIPFTYNLGAESAESAKENIRHLAPPFGVIVG